MRQHEPYGIRTGGDADLAFAVVVLASYFATYSAIKSATSIEIISMIGLGIAYLGIGIYGYAFCARRQSHWLQITYFAVQIPLAGMIVYLGRGIGFNAMVLLPLAGHAVMLLPRRTSYFVMLAIIATYMTAVFIFSGSLQTVWEGLPIFVAGLVFIVMFTQMALNEEASKREVERLVNELTIANQRLREYANEVEELATMKERNRLAREIHDGLGHYLTTIHMQIQAANAVGSRNPRQAQEMLKKAQALTQEALEDVRGSVSALRERPDGRFVPLVEKIQKLLEDSDALMMKSNFRVCGTPRDIGPQTQWTLYRAAQEGVSNICKHSQASEYSIELSYEDPSWIHLIVKDNGIGPFEYSEGFGLIGLRERVSHLNGSLSIFDTSEQGFGFEVIVPG